jgi:hypothetical protein
MIPWARLLDELSASESSSHSFSALYSFIAMEMNYQST